MWDPKVKAERPDKRPGSAPGAGADESWGEGLRFCI